MMDWKKILCVLALSGAFVNGMMAETKDLNLSGYFHGRDFQKNTVQYSVDNAVFDGLNDAILLAFPYIDQLQADTTNEAITSFTNRTAGKPLRRWYSNDFSGERLEVVFASEESKQKHYNHVMEFLRRNNFDGLNIDWEYPNDARQWKQYATYIIELGEKLHKEGKFISIAASAWGFELDPAAVKVLDRLEVMTYDMPGEQDGRDHSSVNDTEYAIKYFLERGVRPDQITMGVPYYGLHRSRQDDFHPTYRYHDGLESSYRTFVLHGGRALANQNEFEGYLYNGFPRLQEKIELAQKYNLHGIMIWEMGFDLPPSDPASLHRFLVSNANQQLKAKLPAEKAVSLPWPGGVNRDIWECADPAPDQKPDFRSAAYALQSYNAVAPAYFQRLYGKLTPPVTGTYTIKILGKSPVELKLGDSFTLSSDPTNGIARKTIVFDADKSVDLVLVNRCDEGDETAYTVEWVLPDGSAELIGPHVLRPALPLELGTETKR